MPRQQVRPGNGGEHAGGGEQDGQPEERHRSADDARCIECGERGEVQATRLPDRGYQDGQATQVAARAIEQARHGELGDATGERQHAEQDGGEGRAAHGQCPGDHDVEAGEHADDALSQGQVMVIPETRLAELAPAVDGRGVTQRT